MYVDLTMKSMRRDEQSPAGHATERAHQQHREYRNEIRGFGHDHDSR